MGASPTGPIADITGLLFWLIFLILILSPTLTQQRLKAARLEVIRNFERKYNMKLITMIHRQEKVSVLGIPVYRYIDIDDSEAIIRAIRSTPPDTPIALVLHTPGGLVLAATQIAFALKKHPAKKVVIIPHYAMSGGTLISLAADEIWMDPNAVLGPLDPQLQFQNIGPLPAPSLIKVAKEKGKDASDQTLILADIAEKALKGVKETIIELIRDKYGEEKAKEIAETLTDGRWTHDYPITVERAKKLGLNVIDKIPPEIYELMTLYPMPMMQRSGVEFIPSPPTPPKGSQK